VGEEGFKFTYFYFSSLFIIWGIIVILSEFFFEFLSKIFCFWIPLFDLLLTERCPSIQNL